MSDSSTPLLIDSAASHRSELRSWTGRAGLPAVVFAGLLLMTQLVEAGAQPGSGEIVTVDVTDSLTAASVAIVSSQAVGRVGLERISATEVVVTVPSTDTGNERISGMRAGGLLTGLSVQRAIDGEAAEVRLNSSRPAIFQLAATDEVVEVVFCTKGRHRKTGCPRPSPQPTNEPNVVASPTATTLASQAPPQTLVPSPDSAGSVTEEAAPDGAPSDQTDERSRSGEAEAPRARTASTESPSRSAAPVATQTSPPAAEPIDSTESEGTEENGSTGSPTASEPSRRGPDESVSAAPNPEATTRDEQPRTARGVTTTRVSLRASPSLSGRRLAVLSPGVELLIRGEEGLWLQIETASGDLAGWVYGAYVDLVNGSR